MNPKITEYLLELVAMILKIFAEELFVFLLQYINKDKPDVCGVIESWRKKPNGRLTIGIKSEGMEFNSENVYVNHNVKQD